MKNYSVSGILLVVLGIILVVVGAGTAMGGMNKMDAEDTWEDAHTEKDCRISYNIDTENSTVEEVEEQMQAQAKEQAKNGSYCTEIPPGSNPYSGGEQDVALGAFLTLVGGTTTYFGNRR